MCVQSTPHEACDHTATGKSLSSRGSFLFLLLLALALLVIRAAGPVDLADNYHQERAASYVLDALRNGNWICQYGMYGEVASKPPMFTWVGALFSLPFGASWIALIFPGALATFLAACILWRWGGQYFGARAGFLATLVFLLSPCAAKQMGSVRIDGFFSFTILLTAFCAFRAWRKESNWVWFWIAAAVSTLTKGPLGLLLGAAGLMAALWERKSLQRTSLAPHVIGVLLFLVLTGGWFAAAYWQMGQPLIDKMIGKELIGHAVKQKADDSLWNNFYKPTAYLARGFLPWVILAFTGLWRTWKQPAALESERFLDKFLFCWIATGLLIFSVVPHQRPDLVFPLVPPAALVAGKELARWIARWEERRVIRFAAIVTFIGLVAIILNFVVAGSRKETVAATRAFKSLADEIQRQGGGEFPLTHTEAPFTLQFHLNTKRSLVPLPDAARVLKRESAAFIVVTDVAALRNEAGAGVQLHEVASTGAGTKKPASVVSNHPRIEWTEHMRCILPPIELQMDGISAISTGSGEFTFFSRTNGGTVTLLPYPRTDKLRVEILEGGQPEVTLLEPTRPLRKQVDRRLKLRIDRVK